MGPDLKYPKGAVPDPATPPLSLSPAPEDSEAMPQLERQNSVFDGGGADGGALPHLSPQLWPPSNTLSYRRHFAPPPSDESPPPPLLMGGKTMVWTAARTQPPATVTSAAASPPRNRRSPGSPTATSQQMEVSSVYFRRRPKTWNFNDVS